MTSTKHQNIIIVTMQDGATKLLSANPSEAADHIIYFEELVQRAQHIACFNHERGVDVEIIAVSGRHEIIIDAFTTFETAREQLKNAQERTTISQHGNDVLVEAVTYDSAGEPVKSPVEFEELFRAGRGMMNYINSKNSNDGDATYRVFIIYEGHKFYIEHAYMTFNEAVNAWGRITSHSQSKQPTSNNDKVCVIEGGLNDGPSTE